MGIYRKKGYGKKKYYGGLGKRRGKRRAYKKKAKGFAGSYPSSIVAVKGLGLPARMKCKLRYVEDYSFSATAGAFNYQAYSANGLYDPHLGVGGHQPMYFDQLTAIYNKYKVLGSKITVILNNTSGMQPSYFTVYLDDDGTPSISNIQQAIELGKVKQVYSVGGVHTGFTKFTSTYSARKMFKDKMFSDSLIGDAASNPTEIASFVLVGQAHAGFTDPSNFYFQVAIDYYVEFFELKETAQS